MTRPRPLRELLLIAGLFIAYKLGRVAISGHVSAAYANAATMWRVERALGLPSEAALQGAALGWPWLVHAADVFYAAVHFPATAALLVWTYWRRPGLYRWTRTMLALLTAGAFLVHWLWPLAPPRLLAATGMIDTGRIFGPSVYGDPADDMLSNQFAAMPSLHVGWAAAVAVTLIVAHTGRRRWLWLVYPVVTSAVVVVTANHYWLDGAVAVIMLAAIIAMAPPPADSSPGAPAIPRRFVQRRAERREGVGAAAVDRHSYGRRFRAVLTGSAR